MRSAPLLRFLTVTAVAGRLISAPVPTAADAVGETVHPFFVERAPKGIAAKRSNLLRRLLHAVQQRHLRVKFHVLVETPRVWGQESNTLRVAFRGGSTAARESIDAAVAPWNDTGRVRFVFKDQAGRFFEWSGSDKDMAAAAEVRISFVPSDSYWSLIGRESKDPDFTRPGRASMNLAGFDVERPSQWKAIVLHEFGHALGFLHEHQRPSGIVGCSEQLRWKDDAGYVPTRERTCVERFPAPVQQQRECPFVPDSAGKNPGVTRVLGGPPYFWGRSAIKHNVQELDIPSNRLGYSAVLDPHSVMMYAFPSWMCAPRPDAVSCCIDHQNDRLSPADVEALEHYYGLGSAAAARQQKRKELLSELAAASALSSGARRQFRDQAAAIR